jgi:transcriptional regulator with XRE-family HTH domain/KaiC/GvpD/RAD55 family RecA-like ATPase
MVAKRIKSGIQSLDRIIGGIQIGDNLVWHMESGCFVEIFYMHFLKTTRREGRPVVIVTLNASPKTVLAHLGPTFNHKDVILVDGFTWGKGEGAKIFTDYYQSLYPRYHCRVEKVPDPHRMETFVEVINRIEEQMTRGTSYLFNSLTGMGHIWGEEKVLRFFTRQCPRLFELDTVAYWILEKSAHSDHFRAQINHTTQVAIDLSTRGGTSTLTVLKAEGRESSKIQRSWPFQVRRSRVIFLDEGKKDTDLPIGPQIRTFRLRKGMSQVELASAVGVSPSTISQVEGEQILLSLPALVRLARALDVSLDSLVQNERREAFNPICSQATRRRVRLASFSEQQIAAYNLSQRGHVGDMEAYELHIQPGAQIAGHFFLNKGEEFGYLLRGEVRVRLNGQESLMKTGDSVHLVHEIPDRWTNPQDTVAVFIWMIRK